MNTGNVLVNVNSLHHQMPHQLRLCKASNTPCSLEEGTLIEAKRLRELFQKPFAALEAQMFLSFF